MGSMKIKKHEHHPGTRLVANRVGGRAKPTLLNLWIMLLRLTGCQLFIKRIWTLSMPKRRLSHEWRPRDPRRRPGPIPGLHRWRLPQAGPDVGGMRIHQDGSRRQNWRQRGRDLGAD